MQTIWTLGNSLRRYDVRKTTLTLKKETVFFLEYGSNVCQSKISQKNPDMQLTLTIIVLVGLQGKYIEPVTLLKVKVKSAYEQVTNQASAYCRFLQREATTSICTPPWMGC